MSTSASDFCRSPKLGTPCIQSSSAGGTWRRAGTEKLKNLRVRQGEEMSQGTGANHKKQDTRAAVAMPTAKYQSAVVILREKRHQDLVRVFPIERQNFVLIECKGTIESKPYENAQRDWNIEPPPSNVQQAWGKAGCSCTLFASSANQYFLVAQRREERRYAMLSGYIIPKPEGYLARSRMSKQRSRSQ